MATNITVEFSDNGSWHLNINGKQYYKHQGMKNKNTKNIINIRKTVVISRWCFDLGDMFGNAYIADRTLENILVEEGYILDAK